MKKIFLLISIVLLFCSFAAGQQGTTRTDITEVPSIPASCNPKLRSQRLITSPTEVLYVCVPTPNTATGKYYRVKVEDPINQFTGFPVSVDAHDDQPTKGFTGLSAAVHHYNPTITITDMDTSTPMKITACPGSAPVNNVNATTWTTVKNNDIAGVDLDYKFCFRGEDKVYRVSYTVNSSETQAENPNYPWAADPPSGVNSISLADFGQVCNGINDDYEEFKGAMYWIAGKNGGHLEVPSGDCRVNATGARRGISTPPNITIQGKGAGSSNLSSVIGSYIAGGTRAPTRVSITAANQCIFRIGEQIDHVTIRDLELYSTNQTNTCAIEAMGSYWSSQGFTFENLVIQGFTRGIYGHHIQTNLPNTEQGAAADNCHPDPLIGCQNPLDWQWDYIKLSKVRFTYNTVAAVLNDVQNSDWFIDSVHVINPAWNSDSVPADAFYFKRGALIQINNSFAGSTNADTPGGAFFRYDNQVTNVSIINSQCEAMKWSMFTAQSQATEWGYPIFLANNIFGMPITIQAGRQITSIGNQYGGDTWRYSQPGVRIYSFGDRFCYQGGSIAEGRRGCTANGKGPNLSNYLFGDSPGATVMFMTGQAGEESGEYPVKGFANKTTLAEQQKSILHGNLPALPAQAHNYPAGSFVFCPDCKAAAENSGSTVCTGGGTGALALSTSTAWKCL
jgi:hypothetical protein